MTVGDLKKELMKYPSDLAVVTQKTDMRKFSSDLAVGTQKTDIIENFGAVFSVRQSVYLYFDKELPCVVLTDKIGDYKNV